MKFAQFVIQNFTFPDFQNLSTSAALNFRIVILLVDFFARWKNNGVIPHRFYRNSLILKHHVIK